MPSSIHQRARITVDPRVFAFSLAIQRNLLHVRPPIDFCVGHSLNDDRAEDSIEEQQEDGNGEDVGLGGESCIDMLDVGPCPFKNPHDG